MPRSSGKTTARASSSTVDTAAVPHDVCLAVACSKTRPDLMGRVSRIRFGERLYLGRGDDGPGDFAHFVIEQPGETPAVDPHEEILPGDSISKRQLEVYCTGHELEVKRVGRCPTYVNGVKVNAATVRPGDTIMLEGELVLVCILRPRKLPHPPGMKKPHAFGEPCDIGMVGESAEAWEVRRQVALAAASDDHVLVRGDTGVGKERVANAIHEKSRRGRREIVSTNASDLSPKLVASELFGNRKGYPYPELEEREGLVGKSDGSSLFLDEVGDLSHDAQTQLLRVMQVGKYRPVGASTEERVDTRIIAATNKDDSPFREDFLGRFLQPVRVPPLSERREDIPLIARHLILQRYRAAPKAYERFIVTMPSGRLEPRMSVTFVDYLVRHPLTKNVRELDAILAKSMRESPEDKLLRPVEKSRPELPAPKVTPSGKPLAAADPPGKEELEALLVRFKWNVAQAAKVRGMTRGALYRLMKTYGIKRDGKEDE